MALEKQKAFEDSSIWKLKVRLQFSGWLQYIIHAIWILIALLVAGIGWLIGYWQTLLLWLPLGIAALLSVALVGTIVIVKYGMHPSERIPANKNKLDTMDLMRSRHSCRSFQSRNLTAEHHAELMEKVRFHSQQGQQLGQNPPRVTIVVASLELKNTGAAKKEICGTLRTNIQGPGSSSAVAA